MSQPVFQFAHRNPIICSGDCLLEWIDFATSLLHSAKRGGPDALGAVRLFHTELLKRISRLTDAEAEQVQPTFTDFEKKLQVIEVEHVQ